MSQGRHRAVTAGGSRRWWVLLLAGMMMVTLVGFTPVGPVAADSCVVQPVGALTGIDGPWGLAFDIDNNLFVTEFGADRVLKYDSDRNLVASWGGSGSGDGQFDGPWGIAVDADGFVYITDYYNTRVQKFTNDGTFVLEWGGYVFMEFMRPEGPAIDDQGFVYITTDGRPELIRKYNSEGVQVDSWGANGDGPGEFFGVGDLAIDQDGYIYAAEAGNDRVQKFISDGTYVTEFGLPGSGPGQFELRDPMLGVGGGFVYVADAGNDRIVRFKTDGTFVDSWGGYGIELGQFDFPGKPAVDSTGLIYVADFGNDRIQIFQDCDASGLLNALVAEVESLNLDNGISNSLDAKLANAVQALDDLNENNNVAAKFRLEAFINEVQAQAGNKIPLAAAESLIASAQRIIDLLGS